MSESAEVRNFSRVLRNFLFCHKAKFLMSRVDEMLEDLVKESSFGQIVHFGSEKRRLELRKEILYAVDFRAIHSAFEPSIGWGVDGWA